MFLRERVALETEIGVVVGRREFPAIIDDDRTRERFLKCTCLPTAGFPVARSRKIRDKPPTTWPRGCGSRGRSEKGVTPIDAP
ncbi:hypothetical protein EVAR_60637_1 [Eumeta japonica]|uniref:Uncharacterized protein n=1 Tax=Eumeta variegata TaxID=151549 RepID=A0A4C1ZIP7_EUMVA|nr:hypothetical protein EVAR_60637_1 [Eumeta japonica]